MENEVKGAELIAFENEEDDRQLLRSIKNKLSAIESKKKLRRRLRQTQHRRAELELALLQLTQGNGEPPAAPPAEAPAAPPAEAPAEPQA